MSVVLLTGFGDFGEETDNPSGELARRLDGLRLDDVRVVGRVLPVATDRLVSELRAAVRDTAPDAVVLTGVAPGRPAAALERVAVNVRDFPLPDIDGALPVDEPVVAGGPDAYLATLPVKAVLAAWRRAAIPGYVSNTAGTYVCNQAFYLARHLLDASVPCGLIHLPVTPERACRGAGTPLPAQPLEAMTRAVQTAAVVAVSHRGADVRLGAGALA